MKIATIEVHTVVEPSPTSKDHMEQVARAYLEGKGVNFEEPQFYEDGRFTHPVWVKTC